MNLVHANTFKKCLAHRMTFNKIVVIDVITYTQSCKVKSVLISTGSRD